MHNLTCTLTAKEKRIYELLLTGASNQEIADSVFVGLQTVKFHLAKIYTKLGVRSRFEAMAYGMKAGDQVAEAPALTDGRAFTEVEIKAAAALLVEMGLADRKVVNTLVLDLLAALGGKL